MGESTYRARMEAAYASIESMLDRLSDESDLDWTRSGNVLSITREDGAQVIVSTQEALEEIWVAARSGGRHFRWMDEAWRDTRNGDALTDVMDGLLSRGGGSR